MDWRDHHRATNSSLVCKPGEASMDTTKFQLFDSVERSLFSHGRRIVARNKSLVRFSIQFALNFVWTPVFFGWHAIYTAIAIIVLLDASLCVTL
jgi:hypothetical protein